MATSIARRGAVQLVTLASATLSAAYYFQQAPDVTLPIGSELVINPIAIGLALTAFALDAVKPEMARAAGDSSIGVVRRVAAGFVFAILFAASMLAVDGFLVGLRSDWAATRGHDITAYANATKAVKDAEDELAKVASARTTQQVRSAMDKAKVPARTFADTKQCTQLNDDEDRRQCRPILDLREEMAAGIRKGDIEIKLAEVRAKLAPLKAPKSADPQADALASWSGVKVDLVAYAMVAVLGFAVEAVACLGVWIVQRPAAPKASAATVEALAERAKGDEASTTANASVPVKNPSEPTEHGRPKGSAKGSPEASGQTPKGSANASDMRQTIEAFVMTEVALGRRIGSQRQIAERFGCAESTVSEALASLETRKLIRRRIDGRCKVTKAA